MTHPRLRHLSLAACLLLGTGSYSSVVAAVTVTVGVHNSNDPFNFILNPGEYFSLDFGTAPINTPLLQNLETGSVIASFYVETSPGNFEIGTGIDNTMLFCAIAPGGMCTDSAFGPADISLSESGGITTGSYTFGPAFYNCFAVGEIPVDGQECGRDFDFLPRMLFDLTFPAFDQRYAYTLTVSNNPIGGGVPEPSAWALMIVGFGAVGSARRHRQRATLALG